MSGGGVVVATPSPTDGSNNNNNNTAPSTPPVAFSKRGRRMGISSESYNTHGNNINLYSEGGEHEQLLQQQLQQQHSTQQQQLAPVHLKSTEEKQTIRKILSTNILFKDLLPDQLEAVVNAMFEVKFNEAQTIIVQGEEGDNFYVVESGVLDVFVKKAGVNSCVTTVEPSGYFGELALMYGCPRAATVVGKTPGKLWALDRVTFRHILLDTTAKKRKFYEELLVNIPILAPLQKYEIYKVADELTQQTFESGDFILKQGDIGDSFYIVEEGEATVFKNPLSQEEPVIELKKLRRGDYFGELALLTDKPRAANVVAVGRTTVAYMNCDAFNRLLGPCQELLRNQEFQHYKRFYEPFLNEVPILASLTPSERKQVADALIPVEFQTGETIVKQGEPGDTFYIVESGEATVTKKQSQNEEATEVQRLTKGDYFGEVALLHTRPRAATVTALSPMKCVKLDVASFNNLLGSCKDILMRNTSLYRLYENESNVQMTC